MNPAVETRSPMRAAITATWALLLGFGVLMLGDGLQGTFLAVRASLEHFPIEVTGLIMSVFSVGFLAGSLLAPRIVERVGHIRVLPPSLPLHPLPSWCTPFLSIPSPGAGCV